MAMTTNNLNNGGQLQPRQAARLVRWNTRRRQLQARKNVLLGAGNPQGNLDYWMREAAFDGNPPLAQAIDNYLRTGDPNAIPLILIALDDEADFWQMLAGKAANDLEYFVNNELVQDDAAPGAETEPPRRKKKRKLEEDHAEADDPDEVDLEKTGKRLNYAIKGLAPDRRITYGVVYPVNKVDLQGEWADREIVEKAAHRYLKLYRYADTEHNWQDVGGAVVESYLAPQDISAYFGKRLDEPIREGAWVLAYEWPEREWQAVKSGKITGYSLGGLKKIREGVAPPTW